MSFSRKIRYFLVHTLMMPNKQARALIEGGHVELNGSVVLEDCVIDAFSEIRVKGVVVRQKTDKLYLKFHKPPGYESSLNKQVENNLSSFFKETGLAIAGRLDKSSEGLLLLSNDGKWIEDICNPGTEKEKEYLVRLDKVPGADFFTAFRQGLRIGNHFTKACQCEPIGETDIRVILTEGKNRQIHRMCWNLGYKVLALKRIRIDHMWLEDLDPGSSKPFDPEILQ